MQDVRMQLAIMLNGKEKKCLLKDAVVGNRTGWWRSAVQQSKKEVEVGRARPQIVGATFAPAIPARKDGARAANQVVPADRGHNRHGDPPTEHSIAGATWS